MDSYLKDKRLSFKAKGLLHYGISFEVKSLTDLRKISNDGIESISSWLKELEKLGYLEREKTKDILGRITGTVYNFHISTKL